MDSVPWRIHGGRTHAVLPRKTNLPFVPKKEKFGEIEVSPGWVLGFAFFSSLGEDTVQKVYAVFFDLIVRMLAQSAFGQQNWNFGCKGASVALIPTYEYLIWVQNSEMIQLNWAVRWQLPLYFPHNGTRKLAFCGAFSFLLICNRLAPMLNQLKNVRLSWHSQNVGYSWMPSTRKILDPRFRVGKRAQEIAGWKTWHTTWYPVNCFAESVPGSLLPLIGFYGSRGCIDNHRAVDLSGSVSGCASGWTRDVKAWNQGPISSKLCEGVCEWSTLRRVRLWPVWTLRIKPLWTLKFLGRARL